MRIKSPLLYQLSYAPTKSAYQINVKLGKFAVELSKVPIEPKKARRIAA
jgi:hypothetical protein